jgi:NAD(P)-dependent dehydrogenase (short-subunit alcohol dehydrogenase family)
VGQLDGKMAIVTGAGTGIGKGIARAFAREGADLTIASRNRENLETSAEELRSLGAQVLVVQADLTDERQILELFRQAMDRFGRVDLLVNNSGIFKGGPIDEIALEDWQDVVDINLTAVFLCSREAMKIMKRQGGGRIINIGSISAQMPRMGSAPYTATKFGLVGLTKSTALEGREYGVSAGCLHPGNVSVEWRAESSADMHQEPMMTPDELATAALAMAAMPPHVNVWESIVLPVGQAYLGRG